MRSGLCLATMLAASSVAAAETPQTIEPVALARMGDRGLRERLRQPHLAHALPSSGRERACSVRLLYDVTRNPRTIVNCYELK